MKSSEITNVIVVFKTHLDIGFTGPAAGVLQQYCDFFIPAAVDLAFQANTPEHKKFVWTVGSYLIKYYFAHADAAGCERLSEAIRLGYVRWHGLACTTHTELMDRRLLDYDISIARKLDQQFGFHTIAAKMTDVPGHTIGLVPALADAGIEYLHLGVNASSRVPDVPPMFLWKCGESEVIVNYAGDYGDVSMLENGTALEFFHAHDNAAPPTLQELDQLFAMLSEKYPNARIEAGTLDDFAVRAREIKDTLPVITEEIGDTWIHGAATDPWKVSCFRRLLKLKEAWIADEKLAVDSPEYDCLMEHLLLVAEHTWGMDVKKYLLDFTNWDKKSFASARRSDYTDESFYDACNCAILEGMKEELHYYHGDKIESSYSYFESSHQEQRDYIAKAMEMLPEELRTQAECEMRFDWPEVPKGARICRVDEAIDVGNVIVTVGSAGELVRIERKQVEDLEENAENGSKGSGVNENNLETAGKVFAESKDVSGNAREVSIGLIGYETFGGREVDNCYYEYGRNLKENYHWSEPDFGKPGLHYLKQIQHNVYQPTPTEIWAANQTLYVFLRFPQEACEQYGCPRAFAVVYHFERSKADSECSLYTDEIQMELFWKEKDAIRSPEAIWVNINLNVEQPENWRMNKCGTLAAPDHVRYDGNRKMHGVQELVYDANLPERSAQELCPKVQQEDTCLCNVYRYSIESLDAPLVCPGGKTLYNVDNEFEDLRNGFYFLLYNNRWGTNFKQWYEEDMRFEFRILGM